MDKLFTQDQAVEFLRKNKLSDAKSITNAFVAHFKDILQAALEAELTSELGYSKYDWRNKETGNSRNGHTKKTVKSQFGDMELSIPRDKNGEYEPVIVKKHERTLRPSLEDMIIGMYARGMSNRDIYRQMKQVYGIEVSADMVSTITDKVLPIARDWQNRPLNPLYPFVYLDGIMYDVREDGHVKKKTVYVVMATTLEGKKDVLGMWIGEAESAKFWMSVLTDLKNRGVEDILIASVDGLKGFGEAIESVYPQTEVQQCVVHQIRNCTRFVSYKDRKQFCGDMKEIYTAPNEEAGLAALERFEKKWGKKYGYAVKSWRCNWKSLSTFYKYPPDIRRVMYTTNMIENLHRNMRKVTKAKTSFPTDDSLFKILYLVVMDTFDKWTRPVNHWPSIFNQLMVHFDQRIEKYINT